MGNIERWRTKLADLVMPWAAGNASVWPSQHHTHRVLMEELTQLEGAVEALAYRVAAQGDIGRWAAECWNCGGTGWLGARRDEDECACPQCDGSGKIEVVRAVDHARTIDAVREAIDAARL
jgi:hypothetical protein